MVYKRVLIKLSGKSFSGKKVFGLDIDTIKQYAKEIEDIYRLGIEIAIVVGGGNYFRGSELAEIGVDRARADYMSMLGTIMNALVLQDTLTNGAIEARVQSAISMEQVVEHYIPLRAIRHMEKNRVVIFGAGLGVPFFSTDSCASQRASELKCDVLIMAKNVGGVYSSDPRKNSDAKFIEKLSYEEVITNQYKFADTSAIDMCKNNAIPIIVADLLCRSRLLAIIKGDTKNCTVIS